MSAHTRTPAQDTVEISGLEVSCIVGMYPAERDTPQPLVVSLSLGLDTRAAAAREDLFSTVDYGRLSGDVRFLLERCRFALIETAAEVLARYVLLPPLAEHARVTWARVRIEKPRALTGGAVAAVCIEREANELPADVRDTTWGRVERVFVGRDCVVERRRVSAGRAIEAYAHDAGEAHELVTTSGLSSGGRALGAGMSFTFSPGRARRYEAGAAEQALLCVRAPSSVDVAAPPDADLTLPRAALYAAPGALSSLQSSLP